MGQQDKRGEAMLPLKLVHINDAAKQLNRPNTPVDELVLKQSSAGSLSAVQCVPLTSVNEAEPVHKSNKFYQLILQLVFC